MNFIETHDSYKKLQQKILILQILYILYNTTGNIIIIMVIGRPNKL